MSSRKRFIADRRSHRLAVERLESRRNPAHAHLSIAPRAELDIVGTDGDVRIELKFEPQTDALIATRNNQVIGSWSINDWKTVRIEAQQGDDQIYIDPELPMPVVVDGGDGSDTVFGIQLGQSQDVLLSAGQPVSFSNRSCLGVECLKVADGESTDTGSMIPSSAALVPNADVFTHTLLHHADSSADLPSNSLSVSVVQNDHQFMLSVPSGSSGTTVSHSHDGRSASNTTLESPSATSNRSTRIDMGAGNLATAREKPCFVNSTTIESRLESSSFLVRDIVPLKPGCQ